jgi:myo-inositol-1-phosphate synthase
LIKVAIVGVGNIASMLVQSVMLFKFRGFIEGVMTENIGGYGVGDIEFVAAFDVSRRKVGKDLGEAIFESPNSVPRIYDVGSLGVKVSPGPILDGVAPHMRDFFEPIDYGVAIDAVVDILRSSGAEVVINLLPVGSEEATRFYARASLKAGAAFINAIPVFIASDPSGTWPKLYRDAGIP